MSTITMTEAGTMVLIFKVGTVWGFNADGFQNTNRIELGLGVRDDGELIPIYNAGGDWTCVDADNPQGAAMDLGSLDRGLETDDERLLEGAKELEGWAGLIRVFTIHNLSHNVDGELDAAEEFLKDMSRLVQNYVNIEGDAANSEEES